MGIIAKWMCFVFGLCSTVIAQQSNLKLMYQWSQLEFDYPSARERRADIDRGNFIPGKPAPIDVDVHYSFAGNQKSRVFVTIPRFQSGVPATLGVVSERTFGDNNPIIKPYPSWEWHNNPRRCRRNRMVSVYRVQIDECQRLWVLDTGKLEEDQVCPPQLLAFDLQTNQLIHSYEIPSDQYETRSIFVTPVVDVRDAHSKCRETFVYMADTQGYSMVVYDVQRGRSWRVSDKTMYPYPTYGTFNILGDSFDLMDGVLGMALSPYKPGEDRKLFFHAMASPTENWVYTSDLRNRTRYLHDPASSPEIFHTFRGERKTQSAAEAMDRDGVMYFGLMDDVSLDCWNTRTEYKPQRIARNTETLQFASGVKVITNNKAQQELWVMTSRFQKIATDTLTSTEINFRIHKGIIDDLVSGTTCKSGSPGNYHHTSTTHGGGYGLYKPSTQFAAVQSPSTKKYNNY